MRISLLGSAPELAGTVNRPEDWETSDPLAPKTPPGDAIAKAPRAKHVAWTREDAHAAKRRATADWIEGLISAEEHEAIHSRADHVLKNVRRGGILTLPEDMA
jgi:hypothetical protein